MKIRNLFARRKEKPMKENAKKSIPEDNLAQVTGGGAFDDVPTVDEHEYNDDTKKSASVLCGAELKEEP